MARCWWLWSLISLVAARLPRLSAQVAVSCRRSAQALRGCRRLTHKLRWGRCDAGRRRVRPVAEVWVEVELTSDLLQKPGGDQSPDSLAMWPFDWSLSIAIWYHWLKSYQPLLKHRSANVSHTSYVHMTLALTSYIPFTRALRHNTNAFSPDWTLQHSYTHN